MKNIKFFLALVLFIPLLIAVTLMSFPFNLCAILCGGSDDLKIFHANIGAKIAESIKSFVEGDKS